MSPESQTASTAAPTRALLGLEDRETVMVTSPAEAADSLASGGVIYTESMPDLHAILEHLNIITAVLEMPPPEVPGAAPSDRSGIAADPTDTRSQLAEAEAERRPLSAPRTLIVGGIPIGVIVAGVVLLIGNLTEEPARPNAFVALSLLLGGIVLLATAILALRES